MYRLTYTVPDNWKPPTPYYIRSKCHACNQPVIDRANTQPDSPPPLCETCYPKHLAQLVTPQTLSHIANTTPHTRLHKTETPSTPTKRKKK